MNHYLNDGITFGLGLSAAVVNRGASIVSIIGLIVAVGGLLCGVSREIGAWLDRRWQRRG